MRLQDYYIEVARRADTAGTKISAADASRVLAIGFEVLAEQDSPTAFELVGKGLRRNPADGEVKEKAAG